MHVVTSGASDHPGLAEIVLVLLALAHSHLCTWIRRAVWFDCSRTLRHRSVSRSGDHHRIRCGRRAGRGLHARRRYQFEWVRIMFDALASLATVAGQGSSLVRGNCGAVSSLTDTSLQSELGMKLLRCSSRHVMLAASSSCLAHLPSLPRLS